MRTFKYIGILGITLLLFSCSATMKHTWSREGYTGKHFDKILVIGVSRNLETRSTFENTTVSLLAENGIMAENSLTVLPPVKDMTEFSEERVIRIVKDGDYDGLLVATLIDVNSRDVVESAGSYYGPMYGGRGYYGYGYGSYLYSGYNYMYMQDYYRESKTYVVESRMYDATVDSKEEALVWSGQSNVTDPSSFESGASKFANTVVKALIGNRVIH